MRQHQGLNHDFLRNLRRAGLNHDYGFFGPGYYQVQPRFAYFIVGRIDNVAAINQTYAHTGNRIHERNV